MSAQRPGPNSDGNCETIRGNGHVFYTNRVAGCNPLASPFSVSAHSPQRNHSLCWRGISFAMDMSDLTGVIWREVPENLAVAVNRSATCSSDF